MSATCAPALGLPRNLLLSSDFTHIARRPSRRVLHRQIRRQALVAPLALNSEQEWNAARQTVDLFIKSHSIVGLGTGSTSAAAIEYLGEKLRTGKLQNVQGVPLSQSAAGMASQCGVPLTILEAGQQLDVLFDDADAVQEGTLASILGRRGVSGREDLRKAKALVRAAKEIVVAVPESAFVETLSGALPVIIQQEDWLECAEEIDDLFLGDAEVWRRPMSGEAGPMGGDFPLVTLDGHYVLDVIFTEPMADLEAIVEALEAVPGVVAHGLFLDCVNSAMVIGRDDIKLRTSLFKSAFSNRGKV